MWFILPQLAGLGRSQTSLFYALSDLDEAKAYLCDPILGPRLRACVTAVLSHEDRSAHEIFGSPDGMKFQSCLTLFERADPRERLFAKALAVFFQGKRDSRTIELLGEGS